MSTPASTLQIAPLQSGQAILYLTDRLGLEVGGLILRQPSVSLAVVGSCRPPVSASQTLALKPCATHLCVKDVCPHAWLKIFHRVVLTQRVSKDPPASFFPRQGLIASITVAS